MPPIRVLAIGVFLTTAATLAGCSSPRRETVVSIEEAPVRVAVGDPDYPAAASILDGYDLAAAPAEWQIGDRVLMGIRLEQAGEATVRMLHVELLGLHNPAPVVAFKATPTGRPAYRIESGVYYTRLTLYDADGAVLKTGIGEFPDRMLSHGIYDGAEPSIDRPRTAAGGVDVSDVSDEQYEHELLGWLSVISFSTSMGKDGMFAGLLRKVVARPSLLTMLLNPDVSLGIGDTFDISRRRWNPTPAISVAGVSMPLTCSISNKLAAVARIHAVRPVAPLGLAAGIVAIDGSNADKPDVRFEVRLLGAGRGSGGRAFDVVARRPDP